MQNIKSLFEFEKREANDSADYAALILRIGLGVVFVSHALLKLLVLTLPETAEFFAAHGFPGWTAYPVFAGELLGGIALIFGVLTRLVSILLIPIIGGAILTHYPNGWSYAAPGGGYEYMAFLLVALVVQPLLGSGGLAVQSLLKTKNSTGKPD